jgi:hypothetical protein
VLLRALACFGVHLRALACSGVLWRSLACIDVLKNSKAVMCVFLKLFVHDLLYKFID